MALFNNNNFEKLTLSSIRSVMNDKQAMRHALDAECEGENEKQILKHGKSLIQKRIERFTYHYKAGNPAFLKWAEDLMNEFLREAPYTYVQNLTEREKEVLQGDERGDQQFIIEFLAREQGIKMKAILPDKESIPLETIVETWRRKFLKKMEKGDFSLVQSTKAWKNFAEEPMSEKIKRMESENKKTKNEKY